MFVRTASERDVGAIRALLVETWHATYDGIYGAARVDEITREWHSPEAVRARLFQPDSEFLVADDGNSIGGTAFASYDAETRRCWTRSKAASPERRSFAWKSSAPTPRQSPSMWARASPKSARRPTAARPVRVSPRTCTNGRSSGPRP
jgi:hypothetical protein